MMMLSLGIAVALAFDAQAQTAIAPVLRWECRGLPSSAKFYVFALGNDYWGNAFGNGSFNPETQTLETLEGGTKFVNWEWRKWGGWWDTFEVEFCSGYIAESSGIRVLYLGGADEPWTNCDFLNQSFAVVVVLDDSPDRYGIDVFESPWFRWGDPEDDSWNWWWEWNRCLNYYNDSNWWESDGRRYCETLSKPFNPTQFAVAASGAQNVTVTFSDNEGSFASTDITQTVGSNYILPSPDPTREGYTFDGWGSTVLGVGVPYVTGGTKVEEASDHTLWAHWSPNKYWVTFDWQGAESLLPSTKEVTFGMAFGSLPWPVWDGWWFEGWWTQANGAGTQVSPSTKVTVADDITLYAKWTLTHQVSPPVFVPYWWLEQWTNNIVDYEELALSRGANGMAFWESFVAGCDPTNEVSRFVVTNFVVNAGGGVGAIDWTPNRCDREYRVLGKTNLTDKGWHWPTNDASQFFKVEVRLK